MGRRSCAAAASIFGKRGGGQNLSPSSAPSTSPLAHRTPGPALILPVKRPLIGRGSRRGFTEDADWLPASAAEDGTPAGSSREPVVKVVGAYAAPLDHNQVSHLLPLSYSLSSASLSPAGREERAEH